MTRLKGISLLLSHLEPHHRWPRAQCGAIINRFIIHQKFTCRLCANDPLAKGKRQRASPGEAERSLIARYADSSTSLCERRRSNGIPVDAICEWLQLVLDETCAMTDAVQQTRRRRNTTTRRVIARVCVSIESRHH